MQPIYYIFGIFLIYHTMVSTKKVFEVEDFQVKDFPNLTKIVYFDKNLKNGLNMYIRNSRKLDSVLVSINL